MRRALHDAFEQTIRDVLEIREQVMKLERKFCPNVVIYAKALDPFRFVLEVSQRGGPNALASNAST